MGLALSELCLKKRSLASVPHLWPEGIGLGSPRTFSSERPCLCLGDLSAESIWLELFLARRALRGSCAGQDLLAPSLDVMVGHLLLLMARHAGLCPGGHRWLRTESLQME